MKYCSKCGTGCFDSDKHCPKCGCYLKDPKTHNKMTFDKFMQTPEYIGCVALFIAVVSMGLCIGSAFVRTKPAAMSIVGLVFAIAAVFLSSRCRHEIPEGVGMRAFATAAYALGIVAIISCIIASACNGLYSAFGCVVDNSKHEMGRACKYIEANLGLSDSDIGAAFMSLFKFIR